LADWFFQRITEMAGVVLSLDPKPIQVQKKRRGQGKALTASDPDD